MKKKKGLILALVVMLICTLPISATAANETGGSVDVTLQVPLPTPNPGAGSGGGTDSGPEDDDETPSYSYIVNIPANFTITTKSNEFPITASKMDIPAGKRVVVRLDRAATMEPDGNCYFYLDGNKDSLHFLQFHVARRTASSLDTDVSDGILASFRTKELTPYDWQYVTLMYFYEEYVQAAEGAYYGTVYYTIGLE